jgi:lipopolysaccharide export system permease protein
MGSRMRFNLYIFNQLLRTTLALTSVLVGIIWLFQTIRILELVVNRGAAVGDFLLMSVASMPLWLMIAVPISGFIAVNWVFSRILADRELLVMQSIGLSPMQLAKAPIALGLLAFIKIYNSNCGTAYRQFCFAKACLLRLSMT